MRTGNLVASALAVVWGGAVLVYALAGGGTHGSSAYQTGQMIGIVFAAVLLFAGGRGLRREIRKRR